MSEAQPAVFNMTDEGAVNGTSQSVCLISGLWKPEDTVIYRTPLNIKPKGYVRS